MEALELDGKKYLKASKAARIAGYTSDYVGQLCRSGKIEAHLIGRSWYVNAEQLSTHKTEKKRNSRVKAREQVKKAIAETKHLQVAESAVSNQNFLKHTVKYSDDTKDLIPEVRQITVETEHKIRTREETGDNFSIENKGEKMHMSGKLTVVDISDDYVEVIDTEQTILRPIIIKEKKKKAKAKPVLKKKKTVAKVEEKTAQKVTKSIPSTFADRVEALNEPNSTTLEIKSTDEPVVVESITVRRFPLMSASVVASLLLLVTMSLLEVHWTYFGGVNAATGEIEVEYSYSYSLDRINLIAKIPF